jgi:hypothetical protein
MSKRFFLTLKINSYLRFISGEFVDFGENARLSSSISDEISQSLNVPQMTMAPDDESPELPGLGPEEPLLLKIREGSLGRFIHVARER